MVRCTGTRIWPTGVGTIDGCSCRAIHALNTSLVMLLRADAHSGGMRMTRPSRTAAHSSATPRKSIYHRASHTATRMHTSAMKKRNRVTL
jgi:hypothetical protein